MRDDQPENSQSQKRGMTTKEEEETKPSTHLTIPSAFFKAFSNLIVALLCFLALASATFRMGLASKALCFAFSASTASFVMGTLDL